MPTLKDISKKLGISVTQVSRALNDHSDVNEATRERVKAAAKDIGYHANISARKLVSGRSGIVGLVVDRQNANSADGIFLELVSGLSLQFSKRGMLFVLHILQEHEAAADVYERLIGNGLMDGFVMIDPHDNDPRIELLNNRNIPLALHGRPIGHEKCAYFDIDNQKIAYDLTKYLVERGHQRIALLNGLEGRIYVKARTRGYLEALTAAGIAPDLSLQRYGEMDESHGLISTINLFSSGGDLPSAIICGSVRIAKGVYQAIDSLGLSVPDDVSVVAHDDHLPSLRASAFFPALTVTKSPLRDSWKPLADCLTGAIEGQPLSEIQMLGSYEFIERNSVATL